MSPAADRACLDDIGLSRSKIAFLRRNNIRTLEDLSNHLAFAGFSKRRLSSVDDIDRGVDVLRATGRTWTEYRSLCVSESMLPFLPQRPRRFWTPRNFIHDLPRAAEHMVEIQFTPAHEFVLRRRLLVRLDDQPSLAKIGSKMGLSRERIHLFERSMAKVFRQSVLRADYRRCHFRFHSAFGLPFKTLQTAVAKRGLDRSITAEQWTTLLNDIWEVDICEVRRVEGFLLKCLRLVHHEHRVAGIRR